MKTEPIKPEKFDPGTTVKGMEYVDVPPSSSKDYKLNFYAYRETAMLLKVAFLLQIVFVIGIPLSLGCHAIYVSDLYHLNKFCP